MDDQIRVSDADRDHTVARLREHFAEGRLQPDELDERISAALSARTVGDLRRVMADLPEPGPVLPRAAQGPQWGGPPVMMRRRPRMLPLLLLPVLTVMLLSSGGWVAFRIFPAILLFWLVIILAGVFGRFRHGPHRYR
jgi:Domain of unknown function (DUF1707)